MGLLTSLIQPGTATPASGQPARLQRACSRCGGTAAKPDGDCDGCKKKRVQRDALATPGMGETSDNTAMPAPLQADASRLPATAGGQALHPGLRGRLEPLFGTSFGDVRVHDDSGSHRAAQDLSAKAYTLGQHIYFGAGQHRPDQPDGLRLLAHELTHTVQQRGTVLPSVARDSLAIDSPDSALEREADTAAAAVLSGHPVHTAPGSTAALARSPLIQRDGPDAASAPSTAAAPPAIVPPIAPTPDQLAIIQAAQRAAAIRTQIAMFRVRGIAPDARTGETYRRRATALARLMFEWDNPNMDQVEQVISGMATRVGSVSVMVGAANDPECGSREGYVRDFRAPVVLCPAFFQASAEQQIRTMIHESAHLMRIGSAAASEGYCITFDCTGPCPGGFDSADSWAQFVHCLSDQTPDQPMPVTGRVPGASPSGGGSP